MPQPQRSQVKLKLRCDPDELLKKRLTLRWPKKLYFLTIYKFNIKELAYSIKSKKDFNKLKNIKKELKLILVKKQI